MEKASLSQHPHATVGMYCTENDRQGVQANQQQLPRGIRGLIHNVTHIFSAGSIVFVLAFAPIVLLHLLVEVPRELPPSSLYVVTPAHPRYQATARGSLHRIVGSTTTTARAVVEEREAVASKVVQEGQGVDGAVKAALQKQVFETTAAELTDPEAFKATPAHKAWCGAHAALVLVILSKGLLQINTPAEALVGAIATLAAYILADAGTGIFHWSVDNYGDKRTPLLGGVIDSFQGHHKYPWTITKRDWQNNVQMVARPVTFPTALVALLPLSAPASLFWATFSTMVVYSQQFHAWSHMKGSELPPVVLALQDLGILVSRKGHGAHHKPPFKGNYCIVSGRWNNFLDNSGFFAFLENSVHKITGVKPRCWEAPAWKVQEEAPDGWDKKLQRQ
jgi:ubiquitin-conjugating enzyme E2 variant